VLGILDVSGWHNVIQIVTRALGLLAFAAPAYRAAYPTAALTFRPVDSRRAGSLR
jgi:hypothetical protein